MSLNDPQWGKRGRTGPPDLDEIWRNLVRRFNELFGRKEPAEPGDEVAPPRRQLPMGSAGLLVALVLVVWLVSGSYIVDEGRRGVVTRFGKYTETTTPGLRWHLPFPIESVEVIDFSQVKTVEIGYRNGNPKNKIAKESLMLTDDENIIDIQFAVQYNLKSAPDYVFNTRKPDDIVFQVAQTAMSEVVGRSQMDYVLYEGRAQIAAETEKLMQAMLDKYGDRHLHPESHVAEHAAAGTGAGGVRRCGQGEPGSRAPEERRTGLRQRRHSAGARHGVALAAGGRRLQRQRRAARRRRRQPLQADPGRVRQGAGGHARTAVSRHDAVGPRQLEQGTHRPEGGLPATSSICRSTSCSSKACRARARPSVARSRPDPPPAPEAAVTMDPAGRDLSRDRGTSR